MPALTVRNLPDDVHRASGFRTARHSRSPESEAREILATGVEPEKRVRMGDALASIGRTPAGLHAVTPNSGIVPAIACWFRPRARRLRHFWRRDR